MKNKLINSAKDPKTFWSTLKRISSKKRVTGNIDKDVWLEHFSNVFNATTEPYENVFDGSLHECFSETFNLQLNGDISHNEVVEAISHLKQNKAGGPDTLIPEILYIPRKSEFRSLWDFSVKCSLRVSFLMHGQKQ